MKSTRYRVAFLCSHVIQYMDPLFKKIAEDDNVDLTVFYYSRDGAQSYRDQEFGVDVKWDRKLLAGYKHKFVRNHSPFSGKHNYFEFMNFGIASELARSRFDAVIIFGYGWLISWVAWLSALVLKLPVLFLGETNILGRKRENPIKKTIKERALKLFFSKCRGIFYLGNKNREFYEQLGVKNNMLFHWPYTVDNDFFIENAVRFKPLSLEIKQTYGLPSDKTIIFFSGKLIPKKCPLDLVKAFEIMAYREKAALVFVGEGGLRKEIEIYVEEKRLHSVYVLGFLNQMELAKVYATADIFAFPSDYEPWGLSLNEAMCYSLPVVVSEQISAAYDLVKEGENGFVFKAGDIDALSAHLDHFVGEEEDRRKMGEKSFRIISEWNYNKVTQGLLAALREQI